MSFLGRGWNYPLEYDNGMIDMVEDVDSVIAAIKLLLATTPGERFMLPGFGSRAGQLLFEGITPHTLRLIEVYTEEDIRTWIPRIQWVEVTAKQVEDHLLQLIIEFKVIGNPVPETFVYPYYLDGVR